MGISPQTHLAIDAFNTVERRSLSLDKAQKQLHKAVVQVPDADMAEYVRITSEIAARREWDRERLGL